MRFVETPRDCVGVYTHVRDSSYLLIMGRTCGRILDFSFRSRTENYHGIAVEFVSEVVLRCVLHHCSSLTHLKGSWGQMLPESGPKFEHKGRFEFPNFSFAQ